MIDAIDCQGLGGGMTLGFVQAGVHLVRKVEQTGDFGLAQCDDNRHLLGDDWDYIGGRDNWEPKDVPLVFGNPPCSGFSMMSVRAGNRERRDYRGPQAPINSCMWDLVSYAAACNAETVVMESVQTAGKAGKAGGIELMRALRSHMEELTGRTYHLTHCFHNGVHLGGSSLRRRYFMVLSTRPFSVEVPRLKQMPSMRDVLGDLPWSPDPDDRVPYATDATWWSERKRNVSGLVDGCSTFFDLYSTAHGRRLHDVIDTGDWQEGEQLVDVLKRYWEANEKFPGTSWDEKAQAPVLWRPLEKAADYDLVLEGKMSTEAYCKKWGTSDFPPSRPYPWQGGAYQPRRWCEAKHGLVMAGNALWDIVHPWLDRTYTYREAARIMGFPDSWKVDTYFNNRNGSIVFGKGVCVEAGEWIGRAAIANLQNETLEDSGVETGEREFTIDHTNINRELFAATYR